MNVLLRGCAAIALGLWAAVATAATSFQIEAIYSNADGAVQFVVLHETAGLDGQQAFSGGGLAIQYGPHNKLFTFLHDLPSSATANRRVLIASQGLADLGIITRRLRFSESVSVHRPGDPYALGRRFRRLSTTAHRRRLRDHAHQRRSAQRRDQLRR